MKVSLLTVGEEYKATGKTVEEALVKMNLQWNDIKGKGTLTISDKDKTYEKLFTTIQLRRLFGNKLTLMLWGKRLEYLLSLE